MDLNFWSFKQEPQDMRCVVEGIEKNKAVGWKLKGVPNNIAQKDPQKEAVKFIIPLFYSNLEWRAKWSQYKN